MQGLYRNARFNGKVGRSAGKWFTSAYNVAYGQLGVVSMVFREGPC